MRRREKAIGSAEAGERYYRLLKPVFSGRGRSLRCDCRIETGVAQTRFGLIRSPSRRKQVFVPRPRT